MGPLRDFIPTANSTKQTLEDRYSSCRDNSTDNSPFRTLHHDIRCAVPPGGPPSLLPIIPKKPESPEPPTGPITQPKPSPTAPRPGEPDDDKGFRYFPPGKLLAQDAGRGREDRRVWLPDMIFPFKLGPDQHAHLNSQIWGYGGGGWGGRGAAGGGECDPRNYDPRLQRDNYCEVRGHSMPLCPAGRGHQGQDIRPPSCSDNKWEVVAVVDGIINMVTRNTTVRLKARDGTQYRYLHMHPRSIKVRVGQRVKQGQVLGRVSRYMGGKTQTTKHLHFDVRQRVKIGNGPARDLYVPIYASLIAAYRKAKGLPPGIDEDGNLIPDHRYEIGVQPEPTKPEPTKPEPTEAGTNEAGTNEAGTNEAGTNGAGTNEAEPTKPEPTKPEPTKPEPTKPEPTKPEPTKPEPTKPEPTKPEPTKPEPTKPEPTKPEPTKPEPTKPEPTKPEPTKPEPTKPEPTKPEPTKPEPTKPEPTKPEPTKPEPTKPEPTKPEPTKPEPTKPEPTKPEPTKPEPTKPEPPEERTWWQWTRETASLWWDWAKSWWKR